MAAGPAASGKRAYRRDPQRREKIAAAVEQVIAEQGIEGVTHRAVAEVADVPLGATTYYFAGRDDLIQVALQRATERFAGYINAWTDEHAGAAPAELAAALVDAVMSVSEDRDQSVVSYELYLAALRRPGLRPLAGRQIDLTIESLTRFVDDVTAAAVAALLDGLMLRSLVGSRPVDRTEVEAVISRVLGIPGRG